MSRFCDKKHRLDEKEKNVNIESKTKGMDHLVDFFNPQKDHSYTGRNDDKILLEVYKFKFGGLEELIKTRKYENVTLNAINLYKFVCEECQLHRKCLTKEVA